MTQFILWYLLLSVVGIFALPLTFYLFPALAGRGYAFARSLGLLVWGYTFWFLGSLGILSNDLGSSLFSIGILVILSSIALTRIAFSDFMTWWASNKKMVIMVEVLFLAAFGFWAWIRALNPDITATEKPMELAFLNSILRSPQFPPNDPWLSGYAISYYYFGYVLVAMVASIAGTPAGVAFNLGIALIFSLAAINAYGVLFSLISSRDGHNRLRLQWFAALLAPLFVLLVSNLEGFLDMLHARGLFWERQPDGSLVSGFWEWLNLKDLVNAPAEPFSWLPQRFLWWWRASRVVNDVSFSGAQQEVIDEFPFFSFLLSDLHPHVLAIPFVLLAIGLSYHLFSSKKPTKMKVFGIPIKLSVIELLFVSLALGALAFLNTWDFPIYVGLITATYLIRESRGAVFNMDQVGRSVGFGAVIGLVGVALYLPFYLGFSSQAGGVLPNVLNPTRGAHLWVMFGSLFLPISLFLLFKVGRSEIQLTTGVKWGFGIILALIFLTGLVVIGVTWMPAVADDAVQALGAANASELLQEVISRRLLAIGGLLTLGLLLSLVFGLLFGRTKSTGARFVALMTIVGLLLVLVPDFFYLRDLFGTRMNTVFKFYYQAWILLGIAASYGCVVVLQEWRSLVGTFATVVLWFIVVMGLVYPSLSLITKTNGFNLADEPQLDGTLHNAYLNMDDRAAVAWLQAAPLGTLVEAVGGSYSKAGRIAAHTGQPNVLGWVFHQGQWRGGYEEVGSREGDVARIYESNSWAEVQELLDVYDVSYIYIGDYERSIYRLEEAKLRRVLPIVFTQGSVVIFGYDQIGK